MARPKKTRLISDYPESLSFLPHGIQPTEQLSLSLEGYEAIRLSDYKGMTQDAAAEKMGVSRSTFSRILREARKNVAEAVISGKMLRIQGGSYEMKICLPNEPTEE